jgi:hypothetical protein
VSFTGWVVLTLGSALAVCGSIVRAQGYPAGLFLAGVGTGMCAGLVIVWIDARRWAR